MNTNINHVTMQNLFSKLTELEKTIIPIKKSRFENSIQVRFMKEYERSERIQMIEAEIWFEEQLPKKYKPIIIQTFKIKKEKVNIKTINIIYIFLLILLCLFEF